MRNTLIYIVVSICFGVLSCSQFDNSAYPNKTYLVDFPQTIIIEQCEPIELGLNGMMDIYQCDTIFLVSTMNNTSLVSLYDTNELEYKNSFIHTGNGPGELKYPLYFSSCRFYTLDNRLLVDIPDMGNKLLTWDVGNSFNSGEYSFSSRELIPSVISSVSLVLNDSTIFTRALSPDETKLEREFYVNGKKLEVPAVNKINELSVSHQDGFSYNLLSGLPVYNETKGIFAEASIYTNRILFFSMDNRWVKSIIVGQEEISVEDAENHLYDMQEEKQYFYHAFSTDSFCAFLYHEEDYSILVFDWDGNPIKKIVLPQSATTFCFDDNICALYTLDSMTDKLYKYDIIDKI